MKKLLTIADVYDAVDALDDQSNIDDFKNILTGYMNTQEERYLNLIEKNIVPGYTEAGRAKDEQLTKIFMAILRKDQSEMEKLGFVPISDKAFEEGRGEDIVFKNKFGGAEKVGLGTVMRGDATTGSYLVPEVWYNEVLRVAQQSSQMMSKVRKIDMAARTVKIPAIASDLSFTEVADETTEKTESAPSFEQVELSCETFASWLGVTEELMEDSVINLGSLFAELYGEAWGSMYDYQVLKANSGGSDTFDGMLYDSSVNELSMGTGNTSFANVTWEDLIDLQDQLSTETAHFGAVYIMSRYVFNILRKLKDDNGNPLWQPSLSDGEPATIMGKPYILSDQMPGASDDAVDTAFLVYGNPKYWLYGNRVGLQVRVFDQTSYTMNYDQIFFRARVRAAFKAGRPDAFARLKTAAS